MLPARHLRPGAFLPPLPTPAAAFVLRRDAEPSALHLVHPPTVTPSIGLRVGWLADRQTNKPVRNSLAII